jgi:DNA-binding NtrC family response regulator
VTTSKSILVVEREHEARVIVRRQLEDAGHFVVSATTGAEAITFLDKISKPHLILLGSDLPGINSDQFVSLVKQMDAFKDIPIAQMGPPSSIRLKGTCCLVSPENLNPIIQWLRSGKAESDWKL